MTEYVFTNNAVSTLATDIGSGDSSLSVASGEGGLFPSVDAGGDEAFYILVEEGSKKEWMLCTARSGDTLSITRSANPQSFSAGANVKLALNATILNSFMQKGVFRTVTEDPVDNLAAEYQGEEVYNSTTQEWWKHCTGTTWKKITWSEE